MAAQTPEENKLKEELADSSPIPQDPPAKAKQTAAEARQELSDLKASALANLQKLTKAEVKLQKVRTLVKSDGSPGMSLQQDHYRLTNIVRDIRKLLDVEVDQVSGG
jgi:hypothetical protein